MPDFTFKKTERLKSKKRIDRLFKKGQSFSQYPLRIVWTSIVDDFPMEFPVQFALSVPKRAFSKAVDRNRLRRQIREAYRLQKHHLYIALKDSEQRYAMMFIYQAKEKLPYQQIETAMQKIIKRFIGQLRNSEQKDKT